MRRLSKGIFATADLLMGPWRGPRILIYHNVSDGTGREMDLSFSVFSAQIDWMQAKGRIVGLEEALSAGFSDSELSLVLTFDDGYVSLYERAFPLLLARRLPFTLYLTTHPVESQEGLAPGDRPLRWEHVTEMAGSGLMTLGSHTHRHPDLRELTEEEISEELETADELIHRRVGLTPRHFAYPKGYWDATAEALVRARYQTAVLGAGPPVGPETDPHRLSRVPVQRSDGLFFFKRKVQRGMRLEEPVRRVIKGYEAPPR